MDLSVVDVVIYLVLLVLIVASVAHKTVRVIDLVQEIVSHWKPKRVPVEALDPQTPPFSQDRQVGRFSGQRS
jgi:hypothetical protein